MSLAAQVSAAVGVLAATGAVVSLWRGASPPGGPLRRGYHWFAMAAVFWCAGLVLGQLLTFPAGTAAIPLSFADLPALLALAAMAAGLARLASVHAGGTPRPWACGAWPGRFRMAACFANGYVLASALFEIGWVTVFGPEFVRAPTDPLIFALDLIHPLADLVVLAIVLPIASAGGRRAVVPYFALVAMTISDSLGTGARLTGGRPGPSALAAAVVGFGLLALTPWTGRWPGGSHRQRTPVAAKGRGAGVTSAGPRHGSASPGRALQSGTTLAAALAAVVAALVMCGRVLVGGHPLQPVVLAVAGTTVLALAVRVVGLVRGEHSASRIWQDADWQFRQLADRTSDAVLLCELNGAIGYASRAVAGYGYTPESLQGRRLADLVHPEDLASGIEALRRAVADETGLVMSYSCRVRAADGTWRHVESTLSRHHEPGDPDRLLITVRDVSAQVALRREVAHLTFHDGLTGLPNRAYVEQRAREVLSETDGGIPAGRGPHAPVAAVIFLDLDGFTAVNDGSGQSAGDLLLAQVAHRLRAAVPPRDTLARWGGDEFAVLIEGAAGAEEVIDIAERLARAVASPPFRVGEADVSLTASVGVALSDEESAGYAWRNADMAMSRAKEAGGGRVEVFAAPTAANGDATPGGSGPSSVGTSGGKPHAAAG